MISSGVRGGPSGAMTSKTQPVSAIRLQPFFSPVPVRLRKVRARLPGAVARGRRASGRIATPLPSAEITSGGRPSRGPGSPVPAGSISWPGRSR